MTFLGFANFDGRAEQSGIVTNIGVKIFYDVSNCATYSEVVYNLAS